MGPTVLALVYTILLALAGDKTVLPAHEAISLRLLFIRPSMPASEVERALRLKDVRSLIDGTLHQVATTYKFNRDRELTIWYRFDDDRKMLLQQATLRQSDKVIIQVPSSRPDDPKPFPGFNSSRQSFPKIEK
jgi:hypothetical protein